MQKTNQYFGQVFLYCACDLGELPVSVETGLLCRNLGDAQQLEREAILVLDYNLLGGLKRVGTGYHAVDIPGSAILNLDPYAPPRTVIAAGGIVQHRITGELLCIKRHGVLDLPKGKLAPDETIADCAMRELKEETGVNDMCRGNLLGTTVHGYRSSGFFEIKTTYWYAFASEATKFDPAVGEGIDGVFWVPHAQAEKTMGYASLRDFLTDLKSFFEQGGRS